MILYPAIDIRDGHAVRLLRGEFDREKVYDADPADAARRWRDGGAEWLHVVDLDGARDGAPANMEAVERIAALGVPVQLGGGLRSPGDVAAAFEAGADRVVLGTAAIRDRGLLDAMLADHGGRVVVSVDARNGRVAVAGWAQETELTPEEAVRDLAGIGVERFLFTPVETDGTMEGPGIDSIRGLARTLHDAGSGARLIASGGVGELTHLRSLACLAPTLVEGVIVGRALYEERFTVEQARAALERSEP